eukprot:3115638-Pleurochrysis_carterae.AAC.1
MPEFRHIPSEFETVTFTAVPVRNNRVAMCIGRYPKDVAERVIEELQHGWGVQPGNMLKKVRAQPLPF